MRLFARGLLRLLVMLVAAHAKAQSSSGSCAAWPGEIDPLPTVSDPDPFAAGWARERVDELIRLSRALESLNPSEAYRIWRHTSCIAPGSPVVASAEPKRPSFIVVQRPRPLFGSWSVEDPARSFADVARAEPSRDFGDLDAQLDEAEQCLTVARFRDVLQILDRVRPELERWPSGGDMRQRQVRVEVLAASTLIALGLQDRAAQSFARALRVEPDLVLDSATTPRKIRRVLERVRQSAGEGER